jgi:hypothetical protein
MKTAYPDTLNALHNMQKNPAYALRRQVLADAEHIILGQEQQIAALREQNASLLAAEAKFRRVACVRGSDLQSWQAQGQDGKLYLGQLPLAFADWQVLYVKEQP